MLNHPLSVRIAPLPDELLSSWFVRLAHGNGEKVQSLVFKILGRDNRFLSMGDPDRGDRPDILLELARAAGQRVECLEGTTLAAYKGLLWEDTSTRGARPWVMPIVDRKQRRTRFGLQACPVCLAEDRVPYFRRSWRLTLHCICLQHRCLLIDRCAECGEPLALHRGDVGQHFPGDDAGCRWCPSCKADHVECQPLPSDPIATELQWLILAALRRGWINIGGRVLYSSLFFEGLRILWSFLDAPRWSLPLIRHLQEQGLLYSAESTRRRYGGVDVSPIHQRYELLRAAAWLLEEWPGRFLHAMLATGTSTYPLLHFRSGDAKSVPFWLWEPVHLSLDRTMHVPNLEEIEAVVTNLRRKGEPFPRREVYRLLNLRTTHSARVSRHVSDLLTQVGTPEATENPPPASGEKLIQCGGARLNQGL